MPFNRHTVQFPPPGKLQGSAKWGPGVLTGGG